MRISDWSSDVCSSDLTRRELQRYVEFAVGANDIALQFAPRVILANRQIGIGGAQLELVDALKRQLVAHRLRQKGVVRLNRDIALVQLDAEVPEILRFGIGRLDEDRKSVVKGKGVSVRVDFGGWP